MLASKVWRRTKASWTGIWKEIVKEVLAKWFKKREGWQEVKGGWEWKGGL